MAWRGGGDSRSVLIYIGSKLLFMLLQMLWGIFAKNETMISASFHTFFDVMALSGSLYAMQRAKTTVAGGTGSNSNMVSPASSRGIYTYGLDRMEIVAAFTNAIALFFVATFMIIETFHTAYTPPDVTASDTVFAILGLVMDGVGLAMFGRWCFLRPPLEGMEGPMMMGVGGVGTASSPASSAAPWSSAMTSSGGALGSLARLGFGVGGSTGTRLGSNHGKGHVENMHSVALHVLADTIGHVSLLVAGVWLQKLYPTLTVLYAASFLLSAIIIIHLTLPLFQVTGSILLCTTPASVRIGLERCVREISFYEGVLEVRSVHWWTIAPGKLVGSMHIRIRSDANEQRILTYVHGVLKKYVTDLTIQIEKDQMPPTWITAAGQ